MTMPPLADDPEVSRHFLRRIRELDAENGLSDLYIGKSKDLSVGVEEGE
jgi:uncharacterized pyridoxal phosphate-containing UPF0001 family protein